MLKLKMLERWTFRKPLNQEKTRSATEKFNDEI